MPCFAFCKNAFGIPGPYPENLWINQYIVTLTDLYSCWLEVFAVPNNKEVQTIVHLLVDKMLPWFDVQLQLVTDNCTLHIINVMEKIIERLNIHHMTTSFIPTRSSGKIERLPRTIDDILLKSSNNGRAWNIYINRLVAENRFNVSDSTKLSP